MSEEETMDYIMWLIYAQAAGKYHADNIIGYRPEPPEYIEKDGKSEMKTVKTSELTGAALDWAVAKADGLSVTEDCGRWIVEKGTEYLGPIGHLYRPSIDWSQGGPLIENHNISLSPADYPREKWVAGFDDVFMQYESMEIHGLGPTPLIAACRAIVFSKLGDVVYVPDELVGDNQ